MPRKQRFKPSRKPKTLASEVDAQRSSGAEDQSPGGDAGHQDRRRDDNRGVIEAAGDSA